MKFEFKSLNADSSNNLYITFDDEKEMKAFAGEHFEKKYEVTLGGGYSVEYVGNRVAIVNRRYGVEPAHQARVEQLCQARIDALRKKKEQDELDAIDPFQAYHRKGDVLCHIVRQRLDAHNLSRLSTWTEIEDLIISNCNEPQTPTNIDLRNLFMLKKIIIQNSSCIGTVDLSTCSQLAKIEIDCLKNLTFVAVPRSFPQLKEITLYSCEKCSLFNYLDAPELTSLIMHESNTQGLTLSRFQRLNKLEIRYCDTLFNSEFTFSSNPKISTLFIVSKIDSKQKFNVNHLKHLTELINLSLENPEGIIEDNCLANNSKSMEITGAEIGNLTLKNNNNIEILTLYKCNFTHCPSVNLDSCQNISSIELSGTGLKNIELKNLAALKRITITSCSDLEKIDLSECKNLQSITIVNCPNLKKLNLSSHPHINSIRILDCPELNGLKLSKYKNAELQIINIGTYNKLKDNDDDKLSTTDIAGFAIRNNLLPSNPADYDAVTTILSAWRHARRQDHTHPRLFGKTVPKGIEMQFSVPDAFKDVLLEELPDILPITRHFSDRLPAIFRDGAIYSSKATGITKLLTITDTTNFDDELVFTTPRYSYGMDYMVLDSEKLFTTNNPVGAYFKLADWTASAFSIPKIDITPDIEMFTVHNLDKSFNFTMKNTRTGETTTATLSGEECLHQGLYVLKEFLHFFIFKVINKIPDGHPIKKDIYLHFDSLKHSGQNQLIPHLSNIAKILSASSEVDYVNKLRLNFDMIKQLTIEGKQHDIDVWRKLIETNDIKGIQEIFQNSTIKEIVSRSYMMAQGMLDHAIQHNANDVKYFIQSEFKQILHLQKLEKISINHDLLGHAQYVYKNYLEKPYTDTSVIICQPDHSYTEDGITIHRPNHGLAHTMRQTFYIPEVMNYLENFAADESIKIITTAIKSNPTELLKLQIASLFLMTGRESDLGFADDPKRYMEYRAASAKNFEQYAKSLSPPLFSVEDIQTYTYLVEHMGNPLERPKLTGKTACLCDILNMVHKLDLMRCYHPEQFHSSINSANSALIKPSNEQRNAFINLQLMAERLIRATGDRQFTSTDKLGSLRYDSTRFQIASTDPKACYVMCTLGLHDAAMLGNKECRTAVEEVNEKVAPKQAAIKRHKYT